MDTYIHLASLRPIRYLESGTSQPVFNTISQPLFLPSILSIEDILINAGESLPLTGQPEACALVIPLAGGVEIGSGPNTYFTDAGACSMINLKEKTHTLFNPFEQPVNLVIIKFTINPDQKPEAGHSPEIILGQPVYIPAFSPLKLTLTPFGMREETTLLLSEPGLVAYVLNGIFEVEGRLLTNRDGISLPYGQKIELECFTPDGLLLMIHR